MKEYIPREDALNFETKISADPADIQAISQGMSLYAEHIKAIPAADVAPVEHGKWGNRQICSNMCGYEYAMMCSVCNKPTYRISMMEDMPPYCQFCGAKMNGGGAGA